MPMHTRRNTLLGHDGSYTVIGSHIIWAPNTLTPCYGTTPDENILTIPRESTVPSPSKPDKETRVHGILVSNLEN